MYGSRPQAPHTNVDSTRPGHRVHSPAPNVQLSYLCMFLSTEASGQQMFQPLAAAVTNIRAERQVSNKPPAQARSLCYCAAALDSVM